MPTMAELIERHGVDVLEHLDRSIEIPFLDGLQPQGDVPVIPLSMVADAVSFTGSGEMIGNAGVAVVEAANGGHEHRLLADEGTCWWNPGVTDRERLAIGVLTVTDGSRALLAHPEHGYLGIAPGMYVIRRQREQAEEQRLVAD
jgi:hypothetical protein